MFVELMFKDMKFMMYLRKDSWMLSIIGMVIMIIVGKLCLF